MHNCGSDVADWRQAAADAGFGFGWKAVNRMPERAAYSTFQRIADRSWAQHGTGVQQLERNLRRVCPELSYDELRQLSRAGMRSYFRYWCDAFRLPSWSRERIVNSIRIEGEEHLIAAKAAGKGAVLPLAHSGNWDHGGAWLALTHGRLVTVAERLKPESLYRKFLAYRNALGIEILPLGEPAIVRDLLRALQENAFVPLLADRDLSHNGVEVTLFGEITKIPPGPAVLALISGSPLLPASLNYEGEKLVIRIHAPIPLPATGTRADKVAALSQAYIDVIATGIAAHPEDWHMMQPLWLSDLAPRKISP